MPIFGLSRLWGGVFVSVDRWGIGSQSTICTEYTGVGLAASVKHGGLRVVGRKGARPLNSGGAV